VRRRGAASLAVVCAFAPLLAHAAPRPHAAAAPWWQRETAMSPGGRLVLTEKTWWPRAVALKEGERFTLDLNGDGRPDTIITRIDGDIVEAIDDTGHAAEIWNKVNTTYVVSYKGTGTVDRMVSYIDDDHSGRATEVELRYFREATLRYAWFGRSYGSDAARIFALKHWQYAGNDQGSEFRGNAQIYINKYDAATNTWSPLSECPFSFWDTNHDGRTEVTLRVSATPAESIARNDTDYANNYDYMWAKNAVPVREIEAHNMRLSFNVDARPRHDAPDRPHSNFSFTMVGHEPYQYAGMHDFDANRRPPQTTMHMPWAARWQPALEYPADQTGFTWDEARTNFRWEGQFWMHEREYLSNTGSPTERWNMRREYSAHAGSRPALYYSGADQRYHLRGAQEAWMEVGHLVGDTKDLEFRWWDSGGGGYLDTVEVYRGDSTVPARVAHFDPHAKTAALDADALAASYNGQVLPQAIATDIATIASLKRLVTDVLAAKYEQAAAQAEDVPERERFCLDMARELYYLRLRDSAMAAEARNPYATRPVDTERFRDPMPEGGAAKAYTLGDSVAFWSVARVLHQLDTQYANGDFSAFRDTLSQLHLDEEQHAITH
jgi:hypothetical protein